jgi:hypothetical protein
MNKYDSYKILLKNREIVRGKKIREILPDLLDKPVPATYGYFFLQEIFLYRQKLLSHLKDYERDLGTTRCEKLKKLIEIENDFEKKLFKELIKKGKIREEAEKNSKKWSETTEFVSLLQVEQEVELKTKDLAIILISTHPDCVKSCLAHIFLFTKNLLNVRGGRMVDPTINDGLSVDLKNAKKFHEIVLELRSWETDKLWDSVWEPFGGQPSSEEIERIPDERIPFEIEEIRWEWGWKSRGENSRRYLIDIRDLTVNPNETLEELEKRIDRAIQPIRKHLSRKRPIVSDINSLFPDREIMSITIAPLRGKYRRTPSV